MYLISPFPTISMGHWFYFFVLAVSLASTTSVIQGEPILTAIHQYQPEEQNVYSGNDAGNLVSRSEPCIYNMIEGIVGEVGTDFFTVEYFYNMEVNATLIDNDVNIFTHRSRAIELDKLTDDSLEKLILSVEYSVAFYLMEESYTFENATCNRGNPVVNMNGEQEQVQTNTIDSIDGRQEYYRPYNNVGIAITPSDKPVFKCQSTDEDVLCYGIFGAFQIHTVGERHNIIQSEKKIGHDLRVAMKKGNFDQAHPSILNITFLDVVSPTNSDGLSQGVLSTPTTDNTDNVILQEGETNAALIIGGSIGCVLLLLLSFVGILCYRGSRRQDGMDSICEPNTIDGSELYGV